MPYSFEQFQVIQGPKLRLRRIEVKDLPQLATTLISSSTWFSNTRDLSSVEKFTAYFKNHLERQYKGELLALMAEYEDQIVAMSIYQYPSENFRRIEIGFTWVADRWQKTFVNSELKLLMIGYAFESMKVSRVEFSVHPKNQKSNAAMIRLGAMFEGTLRKWRFLPGLVPDDGHRNIYSIIDDEWPVIRQKILDYKEPKF